ncbi:3-oxoacyl-ACP synthase III family protein [Aromatoleum evansii]|uniref:3-oxoacyl-ACP synthase III family protein n=1 Tax=Aromatoleum evansii TaxID=59406 RepID=UPI00145D439B|nr:3-oxoacyl-[acyl-carrier-protein] synthase III C-terminal domain-containing protein [Aromatoleum evansii]NMG31886.1 hypothetical protein [Aromatoleum evansii]
MKILSLSAQIPSLRVDNDDILAGIAAHNADQPRERVARYEREVAYLLGRTGSQTRYLRDRAAGETALGLARKAVDEALAQAALARDEIDLLIYCGVGRGFLEPANAYFFADAMGLACPCFDVLDACMSWVRALEIASKYLAGGGYRHILIVNAEFNAYECGYPEILRIPAPEALNHAFAAFTIGEAATATIVSHSDDPWSFRFRALPQWAGLCAIPLPGHRDFCAPDATPCTEGEHRFVSFGTRLFEVAVGGLGELIGECVADVAQPDIWFPHSAAAGPYPRVAATWGIDPGKVYLDSFREYGNLVSASIPAAIRHAAARGRLKCGDRVVLCPASAGMVLAVVQFTF